jgi:fermentation-respiration switch protein FrsA (DUF1100 family)
VDAAGTVREVHVRAPRATRCRVPAVFLLAGFETGRAALDLIDERDDLLLASMDYPYRGPKDLGGLAWLTAIPALRRMGYDTLDAGSLVLEYLSSHAAVDPERIVLLGVSFGSVLITAIGARDARPSSVVLIYGGGDLPALGANAVRRRAGWVPAPLVRALVRLSFGSFEPLEVVERISPRYLLMISSRADELFLPPTATALYERAREPKKLIWYDTGHMDLFAPELIRTLTREVLDDLRAAGRLPPPRRCG